MQSDQSRLLGCRIRLWFNRSRWKNFLSSLIDSRTQLCFRVARKSCYSHLRTSLFFSRRSFLSADLSHHKSWVCEITSVEAISYEADKLRHSATTSQSDIRWIGWSHFRPYTQIIEGRFIWPHCASIGLPYQRTQGAVPLARTAENKIPRGYYWLTHQH